MQWCNCDIFTVDYVIVEQEKPRHDVHSVMDNVTCRFLVMINYNVSQSTSVCLAERFPQELQRRRRAPHRLLLS